MHRTLLTLFTVAVLVSISSCSINPVTGESEFSLVSEAQEIAIGEQQYGTRNRPKVEHTSLIGHYRPMYLVWGRLLQSSAIGPKYPTNL